MEVSAYALVLAVILILTLAAMVAYSITDFHFRTENVFTTIASDAAK
jgi:hypothetical protein